VISLTSFPVLISKTRTGMAIRWKDTQWVPVPGPVIGSYGQPSTNVPNPVSPAQTTVTALAASVAFHSAGTRLTNPLPYIMAGFGPGREYGCAAL
jgi:hypothetical protein